LGLNAGDIRTALRTVIEGTVATQLRSGDRLIDVRARYPDYYHRELSLLPQVLIPTAGGGEVALSAHWLDERTELDRERLRAVVHVTARVEGVDLLGTRSGGLRQNSNSLCCPGRDD
jgi:multidrug efflux pump subunit AcrB